MSKRIAFPQISMQVINKRLPDGKLVVDIDATKSLYRKWSDKDTVKLGDYGEQLICKYLEEKHYSVYTPDNPDKAHPFDGIAIRNDKTFYFEVKTKESMRNYDCIGIDAKHYHTYSKFAKDVDLFIFFIDSKTRKIYYCEVNQLKPLQYKWNNMVNFSLESLGVLRDLSNDEVNQLKGLKTI